MPVFVFEVIGALCIHNKLTQSSNASILTLFEGWQYGRPRPIRNFSAINAPSLLLTDDKNTRSLPNALRLCFNQACKSLFALKTAPGNRFVSITVRPHIHLWERQSMCWKSGCSFGKNVIRDLFAVDEGMFFVYGPIPSFLCKKLYQPGTQDFQHLKHTQPNASRTKIPSRIHSGMVIYKRPRSITLWFKDTSIVRHCEWPSKSSNRSYQNKGFSFNCLYP